MDSGVIDTAVPGPGGVNGVNDTFVRTAILLCNHRQLLQYENDGVEP
jgi:hypothetical protein